MRHFSIIYLCYTVGVVAGPTYIEDGNLTLRTRNEADYPSFMIFRRAPTDQPPNRSNNQNKGQDQGSSRSSSRPQSSLGGNSRGPTTPISKDHRKTSHGTKSEQQSLTSSRSQGSQGSQGSQAQGRTRSSSSSQAGGRNGDFGRDHTRRPERAQGSGVVQGVAILSGVSHGVPVIPVAGGQQGIAVNQGYYPTYGSYPAGYQAHGAQAMYGFSQAHGFGRNQAYGGAMNTHGSYGHSPYNRIPGANHPFVAASDSGNIHQGHSGPGEIRTIQAPTQAPAQSSIRGTSSRRLPPTTVKTSADGPGRYHSHGGSKPWKNMYLGPNDHGSMTAEHNKQSYGGGEVAVGGRITSQVRGLKAHTTVVPAPGGMALMRYRTPNGVAESTITHPAVGTVRIASEDGNPVALHTEAVGPAQVYSHARNSPPRFRSWQSAPPAESG